nr:MAG TPA: hypothetical protein [Crassvirales sp.]DAO31074.1 MAG TPA: hypothetical protein [Crassvirales sp.]
MLLDRLPRLGMTYLKNMVLNIKKVVLFRN